jgi:hypothetical protein
MSKKFHEVQGIDFKGDIMIVRADDKSYAVALSNVSPRLAEASESARKFYRVSPSGYGIHWPEIDEDLTIDGLVRASQSGTAYKISTEASAQLHEGDNQKQE